jgi:4-hydroxybenzoyl-CoA thioesterase
LARLVVTRMLRFGDCDPSGVAYFPSYLNILCGVTEEFWRRIGHSWSDMLAGRGIGTPTVHLARDFAAPSTYGDELTFTVSIARLGRSSLELRHEISCGAEKLWSAKQVLALVHFGGRRKPLSWPDDIRAALQQFMEKADA